MMRREEITREVEYNSVERLGVLMFILRILEIIILIDLCI